MSFMLCHKSNPTEKLRLPCVGYVQVVGLRSIGLRVAVMQGRIDVDDCESKVSLYRSFEEMMRANGIEPPPRNNFIDRGRKS